MPHIADPLEKLWNALLSRDEKVIRAAYDTCTQSERHNILSHLKKMTAEQGWQEEQVNSAKFALKVLKN